MVDMGMSHDDLAQREAVFLQPGEDLGNVVSGIDDDGFACNLVARGWCNCSAADQQENFQES